MDIADVHKGLVPEIHERIFLVAEGYPMAEMSGTFEELSAMLEALGLCHLLGAMDLGEFAENLCRSAHARRYFLRRSQEEGNLRDRRLALSRTNAFLDALVAGDLALARDVAALSTAQWEADWEYEDDFCFFHFLHRVVLGLGAGSAVPGPAEIAILDQLEAALEGGESPRLDVCRALAARDAAAFADALARRLSQIAKELDVERQSSAVQEDFDIGFWPRSFVSVEGLALLKVAEMLGVRAGRGFALCPDVARLPTRPNDYTDFFVELTAP